MAVISVQQAEENLSRLVERAATGEEIVLTESGPPPETLQICYSYPLGWPDTTRRRAHEEKEG